MGANEESWRGRLNESGEQASLGSNRLRFGLDDKRDSRFECIFGAVLWVVRVAVGSRMFVAIGLLL